MLLLFVSNRPLESLPVAWRRHWGSGKSLILPGTQQWTPATSSERLDYSRNVMQSLIKSPTITQWCKEHPHAPAPLTPQLKSCPGCKHACKWCIGLKACWRRPRSSSSSLHYRKEQQHGKDFGSSSGAAAECRGTQRIKKNVGAPKSSSSVQPLKGPV